VTALALSAGPGRDRDTNVQEWDGSGTQTGGRVACGNGRARDGITCPVQHSTTRHLE